jgi:hypothetical protein
MRSAASVLALCAVLGLLTSCALQVAPQGGEKDTKPPVLQQAVPAGGSVRFAASEVVFEFDEYLQLKDVAGKLVVSPPLTHAPVVKVRKNRMVMTIEDTLLPATTYTFNFGDAVTDLNEGNAIPDFSYVVSTGEVLDTLQLSGSVRRAEDLKPEKGMLVMLYPALSSDSSPYLDRPLYFGRTDDNGAFRILNIVSGEYRIFGLAEKNANYTFDDPSERIAFSAEKIKVPASGLSLTSFLKEPRPSLVKPSADGPGKIRFVFAGSDSAVVIRLITDSVQLGLHSRTSSLTKDTVHFWYRNLMADTALFEVSFPGRTDTVPVRLSVYESSVSKKRGAFLLSSGLPFVASGLQPFNQPLVLRANHPLVTIDSSKMTLTSEESPVATTHTHFDAPFEASIAVKWEEEKSYRFRALPGALTDIYGLTNDTLDIGFRTTAVSDYGTLRISVTGMLSQNPGLLAVVDEGERIVRQASFLRDTVCFFDFLTPGTYRLKFIEDKNASRGWDTGDDLLHRQPEAVHYYSDPVPVRANWDVEIKWSLSVAEKGK